MLVKDCTKGAEYVVLCRPMIYIGDCRFTNGEITTLLGSNDSVYQVRSMLNHRWVLWHKELGSEVATYPFNNDIWVKVEDLR